MSLSELGEQFGTGAADVGRAAHTSVCSGGCAGHRSLTCSWDSFCWAVGIHTDGFASKLFKTSTGNNIS